MQLLFLVMLGTAIAGSYLVANRENWGKTAQQAAIWGLIFVGVIAAFGLWNDISNDVGNRQSVFGTDRVEVPRGRDGHYHLTLEINNVPVDFIVDTGATQVVLSEQDARRIGLDVSTLNYLGSASTANGIVRTAPVFLDVVSVGDITDRRLPAVVNEGAMELSLLGMSYLGRYDRIEIAENKLVLFR